MAMNATPRCGSDRLHVGVGHQSLRPRLTWLTNTGISGARLYHENKIPFFVPLGITIPVAVSAFPVADTLVQFFQVPSHANLS